MIFSPKSSLNGQLPFSEVYLPINEYIEAKEIHGIKIFQFSCALFFLNVNSFKTSLYKKALNISKYVINCLFVRISNVYFMFILFIKWWNWEIEGRENDSYINHRLLFNFLYRQKWRRNVDRSDWRVDRVWRRCLSGVVSAVIDCNVRANELLW